MVNEVSALKELFRGILVALAVPAVGCGAATTIPTGSTDAGGVDAAADVVRADVVVPTDDGRCTPMPVLLTCDERVIYPCGIPEFPQGAMAPTLSDARCRELCAPVLAMGSPGFGSCWASRADAQGDAVTVNCARCAIGRRTPDFAPSPGEGHDPVGRFFAAAAQLEAASVMAFRTLATELRAFGAPAVLVDEALVAAGEERRHARLTRRLARARGSVPARVRLSPGAVRALPEVARENAVEGCVRETFGALVAHWQRDHAADISVREAMALIAEDETRHAALAWRTAAWLDTQLDETSRAEVRAARAAAVEALAAELETEVPAALVRDAGMPPRELARALLGGLREARWS